MQRLPISFQVELVISSIKIVQKFNAAGDKTKATYTPCNFWYKNPFIAIVVNSHAAIANPLSPPQVKQQGFLQINSGYWQIKPKSSYFQLNIKSK